MVTSRVPKVVNREVQYRIIGYVATMGSVICLISALAMRTISKQISELLDRSDIDQQSAEVIMTQVSQISLYFVFLTVVSLVIAWTGAFYLSNRIAGPIFNINRALDQFLAGEDAIRIKTRKTDFFHDLVGKINAVLERGKSDAK